MMKRFAVTVSALLGALGCGDLYRYCASGEVGWALKKSIRDHGAQEVRLTELTRFSWDEFFAFDPYTPTATVCKSLALDTSRCSKSITVESSDDAEMVLVFRRASEIVHVERHFRFHGDFTPTPHMPLTAASAVFTVVPDGVSARGAKWLRLRLKTDH